MHYPLARATRLLVNELDAAQRDHSASRTAKWVRPNSEACELAYVPARETCPDVTARSPVFLTGARSYRPLFPLGNPPDQLSAESSE